MLAVSAEAMLSSPPSTILAELLLLLLLLPSSPLGERGRPGELGACIAVAWPNAANARRSCGAFFSREDIASFLSMVLGQK